VGVDIFFVLSGFLITSIIHRQVLSSTFTFTDFYWRRFRRILPALFFMMIVVGVACHRFLDPVLYKEFSTTVWTTALFSSNIFFWTEAGYFQKAAELKPLLHTWSLGVEEQYYIFFPILMILIKKWFSNRFVLILSLVGAASPLLRNRLGNIMFYFQKCGC
jgi:peptidoglycan/LPS O-acetylase OafA/YrhL